MNTELLYRYQDVAYSAPFDEAGTLPGTVKVELHTYKVLRHTERGCWIALMFDTTDSTNSGIFTGAERFMLRTARRRFACPTPDEARKSFIARKRRQAILCKLQMERALWAISQIENQH